MKTIASLFLIYVALVMLSILYIEKETAKEKSKPKPCYFKGYTIISADSVVDNCGNRKAKRHYRPFDK
jgi:hypothetical protein